MKKIYLIFTAVILVFLYACNEELVVDDGLTKDSTPVITSFEPLTARAGEVITITGEHLANINKALIGVDETTDSLAVIKHRVNSEKMTIEVTKYSVSGNITLWNSAGQATSDDQLTLTYPVPTIGSFVDESRPYVNINIESTNADIIHDVYFGDAKAKIVETWNDEMVVQVPFYEDVSAQKIRVTYNDGGVIKEVLSEGTIVLDTVAPKVLEFPESIVVGQNFELKGEYLFSINDVKVGGRSVTILNKTDNSIIAQVPEGTIENSIDEAILEYEYFEGFRTQSLGNVKVLVLKVLYWPNNTLVTRSIRGGSHFMDFNAGSIYDSCSDWETELQPNISTMAYASKSGALSLRNPLTAQNVIKNYFCETPDGDENLPTEPGLKETMYAVLDESDPAQKRYIDLIRAEDLEFEIDHEEVSEFGSDITGYYTGDMKYYGDKWPDANMYNIDDVLIIRTVVEGVTKYGFIHILDAHAADWDVIGSKNPLDDGRYDDSFITFTVFLEKDTVVE